jgi:flagellar biosynthesis protein FliR
MQDPSGTLGCLLLLALRIGPSWIALGMLLEAPWLAALLALCAASCVLPLIAPRGGAALPLSAAVPLELARGSLLALGSLGPLLAFGWAGRFSEAFTFTTPVRSFARVYSLGALAVLFGSGAHLLVLRALLGSLVDVPLGSGAGDLAPLRPASLGIAQLLGRAFELGVVLSAPVLLVSLCFALLFGFGQRLSPQLSAALLRGPLLPVLGVSSACLCISSMLGELPTAARVFVERTLALVFGSR